MAKQSYLSSISVEDGQPRPWPPFFCACVPPIGGTPPRFLLWSRRLFSCRRFPGWCNGRTLGSQYSWRNRVGIILASHLLGDRYLHNLFHNLFLTCQLRDSLAHQQTLYLAHTSTPLRFMPMVYSLFLALMNSKNITRCANLTQSPLREMNSHVWPGVAL